MATFYRFVLVCSFLSYSFYSHLHAQTWIYSTDSYGNLYTLNFNECSNSLIGNTNQQFGDIAVTENGDLYGHSGGQLFKIDTLTAEATFVGLTGLEAVSMVALDNETLFVESMLNLYAVDVNDASTQLVGNIGYQAAGDLTWFGEDLYLMASGQLIQINMNSDYTAIESVEEVNTLDSLIPTCEGLVAANFGNEGNWIVGLCADDVYRICEIDGTFELLCENLQALGFPGGAASRLPDQDPSIAPCTLTSVLESEQGAPIKMFIDEASDKFILQSEVALSLSIVKAYSSNGQLIGEFTFSGNYAEFDISQFPAGVYLFSLLNSSTLIHSGKLNIVR